MRPHFDLRRRGSRGQSAWAGVALVLVLAVLVHTGTGGAAQGNQGLQGGCAIDESGNPLLSP